MTPLSLAAAKLANGGLGLCVFRPLFLKSRCDMTGEKTRPSFQAPVAMKFKTDVDR